MIGLFAVVIWPPVLSKVPGAVLLNPSGTFTACVTVTASELIIVNDAAENATVIFTADALVILTAPSGDPSPPTVVAKVTFPVPVFRVSDWLPLRVLPTVSTIYLRRLENRRLSSSRWLLITLKNAEHWLNR